MRKPLVGNLAAKAQDSFALMRTGAGQANVGSLDAQALHQVEQFDFRFQRRIGDRWALQAVAQGLVVEHDVMRIMRLARPGFRPIVDEARLRLDS